MGQEKDITFHFRIVPRDEFSDSLLELERAALKVAENAYAPYSQFRVGAAARLSNGIVVTGSNQENVAYPSGLCAERTLLFHAGAVYPQEAVEELLVLAINSEGKRAERASPCGACRQVLLETSDRYQKPFKVYLPNDKDAVIIDDNRDLLPLGFVADNLKK